MLISKEQSDRIAQADAIRDAEEKRKLFEELGRKLDQMLAAAGTKAKEIADYDLIGKFLKYIEDDIERLTGPKKEAPTAGKSYDEMSSEELNEQFKKEVKEEQAWRMSRGVLAEPDAETTVRHRWQQRLLAENGIDPKLAAKDRIVIWTDNMLTRSEEHFKSSPDRIIGDFVKAYADAKKAGNFKDGVLEVESRDVDLINTLSPEALKRLTRYADQHLQMLKTMHSGQDVQPFVAPGKILYDIVKHDIDQHLSGAQPEIKKESIFYPLDSYPNAAARQQEFYTKLGAAGKEQLAAWRTATKSELNNYEERRLPESPTHQKALTRAVNLLEGEMINRGVLDFSETRIGRVQAASDRKASAQNEGRGG